MRHLIYLISAFVVTSCNYGKTDSSQSSCSSIKKATVSISGGEVYLGTDRGYPEEFKRIATLKDFDIDNTEVTNVQFSNFVSETGYITTAETNQPGFNVPGGAVFREPTATNPNWWQFTENANWRQPEGPNSHIKGRENDPVVQVSLVDAKAYAKWAGRSLPSEAQWEHAAKAGRDSLYVWGDERAPNDVEQANTWQGAFPIQNSQLDGYRLRAPVGCYAPNDFELYDMIGNVWEWTVSPYVQNTRQWKAVKDSDKDTHFQNYTIKGGSFLCAPNFCARYRAPARQSQEADFSTNHIGFRTVSQRFGDS